MPKRFGRDRQISKTDMHSITHALEQSINQSINPILHAQTHSRFASQVDIQHRVSDQISISSGTSIIFAFLQFSWSLSLSLSRLSRPNHNFSSPAWAHHHFFHNTKQACSFNSTSCKTPTSLQVMVTRTPVCNWLSSIILKRVSFYPTDVKRQFLPHLKPVFGFPLSEAPHTHSYGCGPSIWKAHAGNGTMRHASVMCLQHLSELIMGQRV